MILFVNLCLKTSVLYSLKKFHNDAPKAINIAKYTSNK